MHCDKQYFHYFALARSLAIRLQPLNHRDGVRSRVAFFRAQQLGHAGGDDTAISSLLRPAILVRLAI